MTFFERYFGLLFVPVLIFVIAKLFSPDVNDRQTVSLTEASCTPYQETWESTWSPMPYTGGLINLSLRSATTVTTTETVTLYKCTVGFTLDGTHYVGTLSSEHRPVTIGSDLTTTKTRDGKIRIRTGRN